MRMVFMTGSEENKRGQRIHCFTSSDKFQGCIYACYITVNYIKI